jgi:hypothetical protein
MPRPAPRLVSLLPLIALAAVASAAGAQEAKVTKDSVAAPSARSADSVFAMLAPPTGRRTRGTLTLTPGRRAGEIRARLTLTDAPPEPPQLGWVIRQGQCGEPGPEVGPVASYRPIQPRGDGTAELRVYLPMPFPSGNTYHIDVLRERGSNEVLACGVLTQDTGK